MMEDASDSSIDLYWLPLGAGGKFVRFNGKVYEALKARLEHRSRKDLYHAALVVRYQGNKLVIEMTPVWNSDATNRGVVCEGPVGAKFLGQSRLFRYEIRLWKNGLIPDAVWAVDSPGSRWTWSRTTRRLPRFRSRSRLCTNWGTNVPCPPCSRRPA